MTRIFVYDTTLHDSKTWMGLPFTDQEKLQLASSLDALGMAYLEIAAPQKPLERSDFYAALNGLPLQRTKFAVYGTIGKVKVPPEKDSRLAAMLATNLPVCTLSATSRKSDLLSIPNPSPADHLERARAHLSYLKANEREVFFAADHFFDGFKEDPAFAVTVLKAALKGGADAILLCDTRGSSLPWEVARIVHIVRAQIPGVRFGIGVSNNGNSATANIIAAVSQGADTIQGSINGYSERSGKTNLCQVIPDLELRMGYDCLTGGDLAELVALSSALSGIIEWPYRNFMPFVGKSEVAPV